MLLTLLECVSHQHLVMRIAPLPLAPATCCLVPVPTAAKVTLIAVLEYANLLKVVIYTVLLHKDPAIY